MATLSPRINITIPPEVSATLSKKAELQKKSLSKVALDLIVSAIEKDEDLYFASLGEKRLATTQKWHSHDEVWK